MPSPDAAAPDALPGQASLFSTPTERNDQ
jgi:hypothetical protein